MSEMYSLYRAWLMRDAVAAAALTSPPDVIIQVGLDHNQSEIRETSGLQCRFAQQFAAHRAIVSIHSGYLKALLPTTTANNITISVPNVSPEVFAPLLTFMYTGYLDITEDNIYEILLATHLLHMPRALDLCRSFLVRNQQQSLLQQPRPLTPHINIPTLPTLVKPIPSRKMLPVLLGFGNMQHTSFWPATYPLSSAQRPPIMLPSAENSPFQSVISMPSVNTQINYMESTADTKLNTAQTLVQNSASRKKHTSQQSKTISNSEDATSVFVPLTSPSPPSSVSPCLSTSSSSSSSSSSSTECNVDGQETRKDNMKTVNGKSIPKDSNRKLQCNNERNKVIIDIACCDGPVRFRRVLNNNYGLTIDTFVTNKIVELHEKIDMENKVKSNSEGTNLSTGSHSETNENNRNKQECDLTVPDYRHDDSMDEKYIFNGKSSLSHASNQRSKLCTPEILAAISDEDGISQHELSTSCLSNDGKTPGTNRNINNNFDSVYTCVYCNHTFKSHYCYQKHAKRHINPVTIDINNLSANGKKSANKYPEVEEPKNNLSSKVKREVRLLDMNVQYYPCKMCGSKFPSYYFVHKHRKMCHANEETETSVGDSEEKQT